MSNYPNSYYVRSLSISDRALASVKYLAVALKAAFQLAAAPADDPVKNLYATFHEVRKVSENLHEKYSPQFSDWQHEGKDELGATGMWRARVDCLDFLVDRLKEKGLMGRRDELRGTLDSLRNLVAVHLLYDAATSEFRFRHALNYYVSDHDGRVKSDLEKMVPAIQSILPELATIDLNILCASKSAHASERISATHNLNGPNFL